MRINSQALLSFSIIVFAVMIISILVIIFLAKKRNDKSILVALGQFPFVFFMYYFAFKLIRPSNNTPLPMQAEENSFLLLFILLFWIISVLFMLISLWVISKNKKRKVL